MANAPAYPVPNDAAAAEGVNVREYFAARAPEEPQGWFEPVMPPRPKTKWSPYQTATEAWEEAGVCEPSNVAEITAWDNERSRQRHIQWPFAWADAVLAHKEGHAGDIYALREALEKASKE